jgi:hypothetical protein
MEEDEVMKQKNKKISIVVVLSLLGGYVFSQTGIDPVQTTVIDWKGRNMEITQSPDWLKQAVLGNYEGFCKQFNLPQNTIVRFEMLMDKDLKIVEKNTEEKFIQSLMFELNGISDFYLNSVSPENNFSMELEVVEKTNSLLWKGKWVENYKTGERIIPSPSEFVLKASKYFTKTTDFWQLVETSNGNNKTREYLYYSCWTIPVQTWWQIQVSYINEVIKSIDDEKIKEEIAKWFFQNYPEP